MSESSESFEQPKNISTYPTREDALELQRIAETKATGANIHKVRGIISSINYLIAIGEKRGWDEEHLIIFNKCKTKLYEILSEFPPARE